MKKSNRFKIAYIISLLIMILIVVFFMFKMNSIKLLNSAKDLLSYLYTLETNTDYSFINGKVYKNEILLSDRLFFDGNGIINIDKYGNVRFIIKSDNKNIYKTYLGNINMSKKYDGFKEIKASIAKNNSTISFLLDDNDLDYMISFEDDFKGEWKHDKYDSNLIISSYNAGDNYIWFKDSEGNISEPIKFNVDCLQTNNGDYKSNLFYCRGSIVKIDEIDWVVLEDNSSRIKLMKYLPIDEKLSQCFSEVSDYCYYTNQSKMPHKWSNSYINYYLNNIFINKLSNQTINKLVTNYICDEYDNYCCDGEICGGYTKEEINYYNWHCVNYTASKIRIISYNEFNRIYSLLDNKKPISGNYWAINAYANDKGSSIQYNYEFYILEDYTKKLDVKPIIIIKK